ncbi:hypothetical protein Tco_0822858 [Tanacetum coccineum]|uniref:Uncharacterized protein n=1 Tax=Tanacetum coccineum TaxID=301880 RepID=A0ABQ5AL63_9ASTR
MKKLRRYLNTPRIGIPFFKARLLFIRRAVPTPSLTRFEVPMAQSFARSAKFVPGLVTSSTKIVTEALAAAAFPWESTYAI